MSYIQIPQYDLSTANWIFTLDLVRSTDFGQRCPSGQVVRYDKKNRVPLTEIFNVGEETAFDIRIIPNYKSCPVAEKTRQLRHHQRIPLSFNTPYENIPRCDITM